MSWNSRKVKAQMGQRPSRWDLAEEHLMEMN